MKLKKRIIKDYKCGWCQHEFKQEVVYSGESKKGAYSSTVVCPKCATTIPTWKREETGNVVGKKHVHLDRR